MAFGEELNKVIGESTKQEEQKAVGTYTPPTLDEEYSYESPEQEFKPFGALIPQEPPALKEQYALPTEAPSDDWKAINDIIEQPNPPTEVDIPKLIKEEPDAHKQLNFVKHVLKKNGMQDTKTMGLVDTLMNYMLRGQYASATLAGSLYAGQSLEESFKAAKEAGLEGKIGASYVDIAELAMPSRPDEYQYDAVDMWGMSDNWQPGMKVDPQKIVNHAVGFAGDVGLDPITYTPVSPLKYANWMLKGMKGYLKWGGFATQAWPETIGKLLNLGTLKAAKRFDAVDKAMGALDIFKESFITHHNFPPEFVQQYKNVQSKLAAIKQHNLEDLRLKTNAFNKVAHRLGMDPEEASIFLTHIREGTIRTDVPKAMQPFYDEIATSFDNMFKQDVGAKLLGKETYRTNYFPHLYVDKKTGKFYNQIGAGSFFPTKQRRYGTIAEAQADLAQAQTKGFAKNIKVVDNIFEGASIRQLVSDQALAWKQFTTQTLDQFAMPIQPLLDMADPDFGKFAIPKGHVLVTQAKNVPEAISERTLKGKLLKEELRAKVADDALENELIKRSGDDLIKLEAQELADLVKKGAKIPQGLAVIPENIYDSIFQVRKLHVNSKALSALGQTYKHTMNAWRTMATSMRLQFHTRNAQSNMYMMFMGGVSPIKMVDRIHDALQIQLKRGDYWGMSGEEINKHLLEHGIMGTGWIGAPQTKALSTEFRHAVERSSAILPTKRVGVGKLMYPMETWARTGKAVGTAVEDNAKIALWLDKMKKLTKGKTLLNYEEFQRLSQKAINHSKDHLFDYTDITYVEQHLLKEAFPFYTFMRKTLPKQLDYLLNKPGRYAGLAKFNNDLFPSWDAEERKLMPEHMMHTMTFKTPWKSKDGNALFYNLKLPYDTVESLSSVQEFCAGLHPAKVLYELAIGVSSWPSTRTIKEGDRVPAPFWANMMPETTQQLMSVEPIVDGRTGKIIPGMSPYWYVGLTTALPFLSNWHRLYPTSPDIMERTEQGTYAAISQATGGQLFELDPKWEKRKKAFALFKELKEQRRLMKKRPQFSKKESQERLERFK